MSSVNNRSIEIPAQAESFETAREFIEKRLKNRHISSEIISETMLMFEALLYNLTEQQENENTLLKIKMQNSFGEISIRITFQGQPYRQKSGDINTFSPEDRILEAYDDKIDYRYQSGYNTIRISVKRSFLGYLISGLAGFVLGIIVYAILSALMSNEQLAAVDSNIVFPLIKLYANAMLMVGAPVTFFSLIRNLSNTYIIAERSSSGRRLQLKTIATSLIAVFLALGASLLLSAAASSLAGHFSGEGSFTAAPSFSELIGTMIPSNIFEPFITFYPFPLIFVALIITFALCSVGKYFDQIRNAINACYTLFSKMLNIIFFSLPVFCFLSVLSTLLTEGLDELLVIGEIVLLVVIGLIVITVFYLIRLIAGGVRLGPFLKHLPDLLGENFRINSAIDAVPFNIRYCARNYGMDRKWLSERLSLLAQINLDGNTYLITLCTMLFIFLVGAETTWFNILVIMVLIFFLSFGAPNQPGSILIGMLIITKYLNADNMISVAIYSEVLFGPLLSIINVAGDIVTVAIEEKKNMSRESAQI